MQKPLLVPVTGILANESVRKRTISVHYRTVNIVSFFRRAFIRVAMTGFGWDSLNIGLLTPDFHGSVIV